MMTDRASLFVIVFTAVNILACLWLMWWTARSRSRPRCEHKLDRHGKNRARLGWRSRGVNNPLPRWWLGLFFITVLFGAAYLIVYPGKNRQLPWHVLA